ncbi:MAG: adenylosuccinate lyase [Armatimonadia bacterium]|nr:adenylosuccinate lyase [Armatimonadia bacterium]
MDSFSLFDCVSPLDFRYYGGNAKLLDALSPYVSEKARVRHEARVEAALVRVLARRGLCPPEAAQAIERACEEVTPEEVAEEERRIHHNVRALVNAIRARVPEEHRRFVHWTLTSFDVIDTAMAARFKRMTREVVIPYLLDLERELVAISEREADTLQMGRTHGQHAVPITFGFAMAEHVARLGERIELLDDAAGCMRGKISGAVGAYNASSLFTDDPESLEREVLAELDLEPASHSTQIVIAEPMVDLIHVLTSCLGVMANLADDMRHLQRSEIAEVGEAFEKDQVGSSTMPHKRNPWNFENVKAFFKAFAPRMTTMYLDQLSEHQRDLTNSATNRFLPEVVVAVVACAERLTRIMGRLVVDKAAMERNLEMSGRMVLAEPLYIVLAGLGHPDAHEAVRRLTLESEQSGEPPAALMERSDELRPYVERMTDEQRTVLGDYRRYTGIAAEKARKVCAEWRERLNLD